ncbi:CRISPR-associated protein Cas4 [Haloarcula marismortui]|uniref:CRISPR-associated protein Cas4 n=1 Tax=Haloarcula marismortui TaxID=2238 RepID=UPI000323963E|nr:PD-(D/E)XK nuclease family protein [Haloarcula californiae]
MKTEQATTPDARTQVERLRDALSPSHFREWYRERQFRQNIEDGKPYFNGPASVPEPERHSPSRLLKCHRKVFYQQYNAPEETPDPDGIFWFGTKFEEDIAFPFLERAITDSDTYVQNSVWIDFRVETEGDELQIKGETDPLIVDADAVPVLPTEIKTKSSVEHTTSPNRSHRAQLHAYMAGLSEKYDIEMTEGIVMYGSRETMDVEIFHVEFDPKFWEDVVLEWATAHTQYRLADELPPAEPEREWECKFCPFQERCGQGESDYSDVTQYGLLTGYDYPRLKVVDYLEAHDDDRLTPTLAEKYPDLVDQYGVVPWRCPKCASSFNRGLDTSAVGDNSKPLCPNCAEEDHLVELRFPSLEDRQRSTVAGKSSDGDEPT